LRFLFFCCEACIHCPRELLSIREFILTKGTRVKYFPWSHPERLLACAKIGSTRLLCEFLPLPATPTMRFPSVRGSRVEKPRRRKIEQWRGKAGTVIPRPEHRLITVLLQTLCKSNVWSEPSHAYLLLILGCLVPLQPNHDRCETTLNQQYTAAEHPSSMTE